MVGALRKSMAFTSKEIRWALQTHVEVLSSHVGRSLQGETPTSLPAVDESRRESGGSGAGF
jgi:hypothetical protein